MADQTTKDWSDEEPPADKGRRRFLQATLLAGAAAVVGTTVASAKSIIPPPFTFSGTIENTFRYGLPESPSNWVVQKNLVHRVVRVTDFRLWDGASMLWREAFDEGGKAITGTGFPAMIICVDAALLQVPREFEAYVIRRDVDGVPAAFVATYARCVHFCCKPGWHTSPVPETLHNYVTEPRTFLATDPVTGAPEPQDPIWCVCHNSQYDPVTIVHNVHPPPANVPYIGTQYVHGPATRALPCIPIKLSGTTIEGIYEPDDGGHPEWYSSYCR
jgi:Rieske Fe-S protein